MLLDELGLDAYTDRFTRSALRYESMDRYDVESDEDGFTRYLKGQPPAEDFGAAWRDWLRSQVAAGRSPERVRILSGTPSEYLLFEFEWGYLGNIAAGESIRILDLTEQTRPREVLDGEFWLMDEARAAAMSYDEDGRFLYAETAEGPLAAPYVAAAQAAWEHGESFESWWDRHPQWHREHWWPRTGARAS